MTRHFLRRNLPPLVLVAGFSCAILPAQAAPLISRLTPPSNPIAADASVLARFLPGQKFDLQATVQPEKGKTIQQVVFSVDGETVVSLVDDGSIKDQFAGQASLLKNGLVKTVAENSIVASYRGYSSRKAGLHTLTVTTTDSSGEKAQRNGNFEIVGIKEGNGRPAKNIIILLGDGMGAAHRTAARIVAKGYLQGKAQGRLAMDTFPYTALVMTASLDSIVTDSAPGMSNYVTGNKANNNQEGVFPDDTTAAFDNPRIEYLAEYLHRLKGSSLGIVTTADVFDATPAAMAVHTANRGNGTGIVDQFLDDRGLTGLKVLMGGGRKWFIPRNVEQSAGKDATSRSFDIAPAQLASTANGSARASGSDYTLSADIVAGWGAAAGALDPDRDLIADFQKAGFAYAPDNTALQKIGVPDKLLGLFALSNMNVALDKINGRRGVSAVTADYGFPDQPMLDEMTAKALQVLDKDNDKGFVLMVEGASIDKQAHLMDSDRWILETIEFDRAVKVAQDYAKRHPDTIVIVTADHECSGAAIIGASTGKATGASASSANVGTYEQAKFPAYKIAADGYPENLDIAGKVLIGYGANADRYESWLSNALPTQDTQQPFVGSAPLNSFPANPNERNKGAGYFVSGQVHGQQAVHTATDVPLSAYGRGASLFSGVIDNTDVFFKLGQIAIGGVE